MFKNKFKRLFLMLGVIFLSTGLFGCTNNSSFKSGEFNAVLVAQPIGFSSYITDLKVEIQNNQLIIENEEVGVLSNGKINQGDWMSVSDYNVFRNEKLVNLMNIEKCFAVDSITNINGANCFYLIENENNQYLLFATKSEGNVKIFKAYLLMPKQDYYHSYSFSHIKKLPDFIGEDYNLGFGERRYYFISTFSELKNIFESSTGYEIIEYFSEEIFTENLVLCVVRDESSGTANIRYSNFKVNGLELSIEETFIDGGAEVVSRYLDFVVIPQKLFPNGSFNQDVEYYWK